MKYIRFVYGDRIAFYESKKERRHIFVMRGNYLDWMKYSRENGYNLFHQDETWVFNNMAKTWEYFVDDSTKNTFYVPSRKVSDPNYLRLGLEKLVCSKNV